MCNRQRRPVAVTKSFARPRINACHQAQPSTSASKNAKQRQPWHIHQWKNRRSDGDYTCAKADGGDDAGAIFALLQGECFGAWCAHRFARKPLNYRRGCPASRTMHGASMTDQRVLAGEKGWSFRFVVAVCSGFAGILSNTHGPSPTRLFCAIHNDGCLELRNLGRYRMRRTHHRIFWPDTAAH